jgi:histidine ammonia-lyase
VRSASKRVDADRALSPDIAAVAEIISTATFQKLIR